MAVRRQRAGRGFTLVEILTVMLIMMLLLSVAVVEFASLTRGKALNSSTMKFKSALVLARQTAITQRQRTTITYGNDTEMVPAAGYYVITNTVQGLIGETNHLEKGIMFTNDEPARLTFMLDGSLTNSFNSVNGIYISILEKQRIDAGGQGSTNQIRLYPLTGRAKIMQ